MVSFRAGVVLVALLIAESVETIHPVRASILTRWCWIDCFVTDRSTDAIEALEVATAIGVCFTLVVWDADSTDASMPFWAAIWCTVGEVRTFR